MATIQRKSETSSLLRRLDWPTIIIYLIMVVMGVISIYAASYDFDNASMLSGDEFSGKQVRWILLSIALAFVILLIDTRMYEAYAFPIYIVVMLLLLITPFIAHDIKGSKSWISLGGMSLQPAEFAKFATALALAKLFNGYHFVLNAKPSNYVKALGLIFCPIVLILLQNETGSALTFMALFFVLYREGMSGLVLFAAVLAVAIFVVTVKFTETAVFGIPSGEFSVLVMLMVIMLVMTVIYSHRIEIARNLLIFFGAVVGLLWLLSGPMSVAINGMPYMISALVIGGIYLIIEGIRHRCRKLFVATATALAGVIFMFSVNIAFGYLQPHQQMRIKVVLGIEDDLRGAGYNVNQSKIAIGSGGLTGKGFLNGTQTKLKYVPEQHTDFIFCTIGEEEGFMGTLAVTALFLALILRVIVIAERQPKAFGRVYAYCVASFLFFHFFVNIGMVIGLCPVIGIPLPFFSYGGSSLWGFTILLFILLKIDATRSRAN